MNTCEDPRNGIHKIPKASALNVKTLTDKNLQSDKMIRTGKKKTIIKNNGLDFFKQFSTLKELI